MFSIRVKKAPIFLFKKRKGQATVEYLLIMAWVVAGVLILAVLFYKKLLGTFFTIIGMVMGAGTPQT
ncbi:MAG: hypothetical protein GX447_06870 [Elusimicrobia bacterium]|nr:hypothetical protein [Elusimicrobiota bacterium]